MPAVEKGVPTIFFIGAAGATLFSWETFRSALRSLRDPGVGGLKWLLVHLAVLATLLGWASLCRANLIFPSPYWEIWMWVRVALELLAPRKLGDGRAAPFLLATLACLQPRRLRGRGGLCSHGQTFGHLSRRPWGALRGFDC